MLEVCFQPGAGVLDEPVYLAAAEQECCSFPTWTVKDDEGSALLRVLANPTALMTSPPSRRCLVSTDSRETVSNHVLVSEADRRVGARLGDQGRPRSAGKCAATKD